MRTLFRTAAVAAALFVPLSAARAQQHDHGGSGTQLLGFTDLVYRQTDRTDIPGGFVEGQFVGHLTAALTDRVTFIGEVSATPTSSNFNIEIERTVLRVDFADAFKLSAGRYHTPVSYWNTAYHHGLWLQTSVARPEMVRFGSRFIPVHFVGVQAEGSLPLGGLGLGYAAGVGNGRGSNIARGGDAGDVDGRRAWVASVHSRPTALYGLQVGGAFYSDKIGSKPDSSAHEQISSAHVVYDRGAPELVAEYTRVEHDPVTTGPRGVSDGYYAQFGYRLPGALSAVKPYVRYERMDVDAADVVFSRPATAVADYDALVGGVRYDFSPQAALKAEYRGEEVAGAKRLTSLYLQLSLTFPRAPGAEP